MRFADVAIFPFIRQFAGVDKMWFETSPYENLQRWLNACINTELFAAIMKSK
jgi:glutathione S-transferase